MQIPPPDAIHGKAIDKACEDDRIWFEQNVGKRFRLREVVPFEFNGPMGNPPRGMRWRAIIVQLELGVRIRQPIGLPLEAPNEGASQEQLEKLFIKVVPEALRGKVELAVQKAKDKDATGS